MSSVSFPKSGPYKGSDFQDLLSLILTLSDETKILKMAGLFQKSNTDAPGAFVDPTLQLSDDTTPDFSDFNILDDETAFDVLAGAMDPALVTESSATSFADLMAGADLTSLNVNELASLAHEVQNAAIEAASEKADVDEVASSASNRVFAHVVAKPIRLRSTAWISAFNQTNPFGRSCPLGVGVPPLSGGTYAKVFEQCFSNHRSLLHR